MITQSKPKIRLFEMMARKNIKTIKELHEKTFISRTLLSKLINDEHINLRLDTIERLCEALECDIDELITLNTTKKAN